MSAMLGKALEGLGLQPGQTYRAVVEGHDVEVRVLKDDTPTPGLEEQVMLGPWAWFPDPKPSVVVRVTSGPLELSPPPDIPSDEAVE